MCGQICETCKWFHVEHGRCNLPEEELMDLLEHGYSSDRSCSKYRRDESLPEEPPKPAPKTKRGFDAWGLYEYVTETHHHDRLDEERERVRTRED